MPKPQYTIIPPDQAQPGDLLKFTPEMKPSEVWTWRDRKQIKVWPGKAKAWVIIEVMESELWGFLALVNRGVDWQGNRVGEDEFVWIKTDDRGMTIARKI